MPIIITRGTPDFDYPASQTMLRLIMPVRSKMAEFGLNLDDRLQASNERLMDLFRILFKRFRPGTVYANPLGAVQATSEDRAFFRAARQLQGEWLVRMNDFLGFKVVHRHSNSLHPLVKQLVVTGVLFIHGRHIYPNNWPDRSKRTAKSKPAKTMAEDCRILAGEQTATSRSSPTCPMGD